MGRQLWLADAMADAFRGVNGYRVEVWPGWEHLGNPSFDPIGTLDHHTGGGGTYDNVLRYMLEVSSIAPSCNWATSPPVNGVVRVTVCCSGRANHAGKGGGGRGGTPWILTDHGNYRLLGGEHHNNGSARWPAQQYEGIVAGTAALLAHLGRSASRAELHKSYAPGRKPDMHTITHAGHQRAVADRLSHPLQEDDMTPAQAAQLQAVHDSIKGIEARLSNLERAHTVSVAAMTSTVRDASHQVAQAFRRVLGTLDETVSNTEQQQIDRTVGKRFREMLERVGD